MTDCTLRGDVSLGVGETLRLLQVTDTHLMAEPGGTLLNVDTDSSLAAVLSLAQARSPNPDAVLITGDIAGDGAESAYERLEHALTCFAAPSFWLPGNHDDCVGSAVPAMRFTRNIVTPHWHIVMLNSQVEGKVEGELSPAELDALAAAVDAANTTSRHLLVALHHPLLPLDCAWLDPQRVANAEAFFAELQRAKGTKLVISGHVHQESERHHGDIRLLTTPSTCIQFAPQQQDFKVEIIGPGYRWLELSPCGGVATSVERVTDQSFPVDVDSGGYL